MLLPLAMLILAAASANAATRYVKQDASGANNGTSWIDAFTDLQPAITVAVSGDEVWVATGTYKPTSYPNGGSTSRYMHFSLKNGVAVYGGFIGTETLLSERNISANLVILSGDIGVAESTTDNCYHVFYHPSGLNLDATAILDGVTITAGNASSSSPHNSGGGMYNDASSPTITGCTISGNSAGGGYGGGIYNTNSSSPTVGICTFSANSGGGIRNSNFSSPTVVGCTFSDNSSGSIDNVSSSPTITDCMFTNNAYGIMNSASSPSITNCDFIGNATGIYNSSSSSPTITDCALIGNATKGIWNISSSPVIANCSFIGNSSGGLDNSSSSSPTITNCAFIGNSMGGINNSSSTPTITNCTFSGNSGSGIYNSSSSPTITNCTFSDNTATFSGGGIYNSSSSPIVNNCILWGNADGQISGGTPVVSYCIVQGGFAGGTNIITDDPQLGGLADNGGPTMTCAIPVTSVALTIPESAGDNWNGCPDDDQRGYARPSSGFRAIGAYQPGVGKPAIQTAPVTENSGTVATSGAAFLDEGSGYSAATKGLCWSNTRNPTPSDFHLEIGAGFAPFSAIMTNVVPGPIYHVRAYAQLDDGSYIYGQDISFRNYRKAYVVPGGSGTQDGSSWANAYADPQVAIENATEVWIAAGTYKPTSWPSGGSTSRYMHFSLNNGVAVYGGFAGTEILFTERNVSAHPTILSGDIGTPGVNTDNCYHVFYHPGGLDLDTTAILDGFTIIAGKANSSGSIPHRRGGGIYNYTFSPTITNCTFKDNISTDIGGGIYNHASSPTITNCSFSGNSASSGGSICNSSSAPAIANCTFSGNTASTYGGGIYNYSSSPSITNCTFSGNSASSGGSIYNSSSAPTITSCTFRDNLADLYGGGIYGGGTLSTIANSTFINNSARYGGGVYIPSFSPTITNCTFNGNTVTSSSGSGGFGGGIYISSSVSPTIAN
jgi:parallel beta-helix repeat protein/predicted outer membrane repeat protein